MLNNPVATVTLKLHQFRSAPSLQEIETIGRRYLKKTFVRHDLSGKVSPFCHTKDGQPVKYETTYYKLICKEDKNTAVRTVDPTRVQRLHWIIPVIQEKAKNVQMTEDKGKRRYYIKPLNYLVVLDKNGGEFSLITAYWVTEQWEKERIRRQFKK